MIDLCIVATLRPEILERTLDSFKKHIKCGSDIFAIVNIDLIPKKTTKDAFKIMEMIKGYFPENIINSEQEGNFAHAVKTVWSVSKAEWVFHLEDDWEFLTDIDLDFAIDKLEKTGNNYMRFPKEQAPHLNCMFKPALQPCLIRGTYAREFAEYMRTDKDPEKQLRIQEDNKPKFNECISRFINGGLLDYPAYPCCRDIGREWREQHGFKKWNAKEPETGKINPDKFQKVTWYE
jgi:hypothetical protein